MNSNSLTKFSQFWMILLLTSCVATQPQNSLNFDKIWTQESFPDSPSVGLVQLLRTGNSEPLGSPVVSTSTSLKLDFDILNEDFQYLSFKLFHCNADWTPSLLRDLEFLETFNEFPIRDYNFSQTNYESYTNYHTQLPRVTKSGNYLLAVFDEDTNEILFTRRFSVFEPLTQVGTSLERPQNIALRNSHHQISFEINYGNLNVINPHTDIKTYVIQNHNWKIGFNNIAPTQIRIDQQQLIYENFSDENTIPAWNEFRFFDTRRISNKGLRVSNQYQSDRGAEIFLETDLSNGGLAYSQVFQQDLNGWYQLGNRDFLETDINSEYTYVHFEIKSPEVSGFLFVNGRFNNWAKSLQNQLSYDSSSGSYKGEILMKQGYYNYRYELVSTELESYYFEGSHFQTSNEYELLVYFREPGTVYDRLVGYARF